VQRVSPISTRFVCSVSCSVSRVLVFQVPNMCGHHVSIHYGTPVGSLRASCGEIAGDAQVAYRRHCTGQAVRNAQKHLPTHFGDDCPSRGRAKSRGWLRAQIQTRPAPSSSLAAMPRQVFVLWRMAKVLIVKRIPQSAKFGLFQASSRFREPHHLPQIRRALGSPESARGILAARDAHLKIGPATGPTRRGTRAEVSVESEPLW